MPNIARLFLEYARLDRRRTSKGLSVKQLERWNDLRRRVEHQLNAEAPPPGAEQRGSIRVPTRLNCSFESIGTLQKAIITNLSRTGLFINTSSPLPIGSKLELRILIEETGREIQIPASVATNNLGPSFDVRSTGMGLRFQSEVPEITDQLADLYEQQIQEAYTDEDS